MSVAGDGWLRVGTTISRPGPTTIRASLPGGRDAILLSPADAAGRSDRAGFKDTVRAHPGHFTTIRARYELSHGVTAPQTYVYHCHILEHEDNGAMRPFTVTPGPARAAPQW